MIASPTSTLGVRKMGKYFTEAEREFVYRGGNLWYVNDVPDRGWEVVRWSKTGHQVVAAGNFTRTNAETLLLALVRPSSCRAISAVHHEIMRRNTQERTDSPLCTRKP